MLESGLVNSETKDCPIRPMLKTKKNIDTQDVRLLCTYFSSPNPEIILQNYYINSAKFASSMNFI